MPAQRIAGGDEPAMQSDIHGYRLAYGKGSAMKLHHISVIAAALLRGSDRRSGTAADQFRSDGDQLDRRQQYQTVADRR